MSYNSKMDFHFLHPSTLQLSLALVNCKDSKIPTLTSGAKVSSNSLKRNTHDAVRCLLQVPVHLQWEQRCKCGLVRIHCHSIAWKCGQGQEEFCVALFYSKFPISVTSFKLIRKMKRCGKMEAWRADERKGFEANFQFFLLRKPCDS